MNVVWNLNSSGFYMSQNFMGFAVRVMYVNIQTDEISTITDSFPYATRVVGIKDAETLIVFSNNTPAIGGTAGKYFMNRQGEYLGPVENPHLRYEYSYELQKAIRGAFGVEYYPQLELFVFALQDSSVSGRAICISNLDGSYYQVLAEGYSDANPTYSPIDNVVYFERREYTGSTWVQHPIMRVNIDSKRIDVYFKANRIKGATKVKAPNF